MGFILPVMKQNQLKYAARQYKQSSHRGAGGLWGSFEQISLSDMIIHQRGTKPHDLGFWGTFDRAWSSRR